MVVYKLLNLYTCGLWGFKLRVYDHESGNETLGGPTNVVLSL